MIHHPSDNWPWLRSERISYYRSIVLKTLVWKAGNGTVQHTFNTFSPSVFGESATDNRCLEQYFSAKGLGRVVSWTSPCPQLKDVVAASEPKAILPTATTSNSCVVPVALAEQLTLAEVDGWSRWTCQRTWLSHLFVDFIEIPHLDYPQTGPLLQLLGHFMRLFHHRKSCRPCGCLVIVWNC